MILLILILKLMEIIINKNIDNKYDKCNISNISKQCLSIKIKKFSRLDFVFSTHN